MSKNGTKPPIPAQSNPAQGVRTAPKSDKKASNKAPTPAGHIRPSGTPKSTTGASTSKSPNPADTRQTQKETQSNVKPTTTISAVETLSTTEAWWRDQSDWLEKQGYVLRARFKPGWQPSWKQAGKKIPVFKREDAQVNGYAYIMDAMKRPANDKKGDKQEYVCLKRINKRDFPHEVKISRRFGSADLAKDPANHCVPILAVLDVPKTRTTGGDEWQILVMPLLLPFTVVPWKTVDEVRDFIGQLFKGLQFMHKNNLAHRDCGQLNIMMDTSICIGDFHPTDPTMDRSFTRNAKYTTRAKARPKYYYIDFGLSRYYSNEEKAHYDGSGDKTVPEFKNIMDGTTYDPFAADVYMLGNVLLTYFNGQDKRSALGRANYGLGPLQNLLKDMTNQDPSKRPNMDTVVQTFNDLVSSPTAGSSKASGTGRSAPNDKPAYQSLGTSGGQTGKSRPQQSSQTAKKGEPPRQGGARRQGTSQKTKPSGGLWALIARICGGAKNEV